MKYILIISLILSIGVGCLAPDTGYADGLIDFENGIDGQPIFSTIPGLQFTTTAGQDWIYGDWRTESYNGPYPNGSYYSNGNFFAWLGPNQGYGRIDFTEGCASYLQVWVSTYSGLTIDGYNDEGELIATASVSNNLDTGQMSRLRVDAQNNECLSYVILHDTGNHWLIDDLSTDAGSVPNTRPPVVVLPGLMGTRLDNRDSCNNNEVDEIWPAPEKLIWPFDKHLEHLKLAEDGQNAASPCNHIFPVEVIRNISIMQFYGPLIDFLQDAGFEVFVFPYDWRLDLRSTASQLDQFVDGVLTETDAQNVNIVDHSLGGLLARYHVTSSKDRADKVEQVISLGTPFLGAPKSLKVLRVGDDLPVKGIPLVYPPRVRDLAQNAPAMYQILPSRRYFDVYGQGYYRVDGQLQNWNQTQASIYVHHNFSLAADAEAFHSPAMDDWSSTDPGVPFRLIVGTSQEGTIGEVHQHTLVSWQDWSLNFLDIIPTNGDGTVPLHSADLKGNGYDYTGGTPIWYTKDLDHVGLVTTSYIHNFLRLILSTPPNVAALQQAQSQSMAKRYPASAALFSGDASQFGYPQGFDAVPPPPPEMSEQPFAVNGGQIAAFGASALHVYDNDGNHTGPNGPDTIELDIPGSSYTTSGNAVFVTIPAGETYRIEVESDQVEEVTLKLRDVKGIDTDLMQRVTTYANVETGKGGRAETNYQPDTTAPAQPLLIDRGNDGTIDETMPPSYDVTGELSRDLSPPTIDIQLQGDQSPFGWYIGDVSVTIDTDDDLAGVHEVTFSLDGGDTVQPYIGPFHVDADEISTIIVKAFDKAGNEASTRRLIGSLHVFAPIISSAGGTRPNQPPYSPSNPWPPDSATNQPLDITLSWSGGDPDGDNVTYTVYFESYDRLP